MRERFPELDGLRGLAALVVVLCHYVGSFPVIADATGTPDPTASPLARLALAVLHLPFSGPEAVIVFFVLSGFVLSLPYEGGRAPRYQQYLVRRAFRIYVPYLAVMLAAATLVVALRPVGIPSLGEWFNSNWTRTPSWTDARAIILAWDAGALRLDAPVWSLEHEMRISLAFPFVALFVARVRWPVSATVAIWLLLLGRWIGAFLPFPVPSEIADSLHYSGLFFAGATLAKQRVPLSRLLRRARWPGRAILIVASVMLYDWAWIGGSNPFSADAFVGAGACLLIACVMCEPRAVGALSSGPPQWLGRVSYSLYLTHLPVLLALVYSLGGLFPPQVVVIVAFPTALAVAALSYRFLERPSQDLGRFLSGLQPQIPATTIRRAPAGMVS